MTVTVGHNFLGFDLDVLLHRMAKTGTKNWSVLGRLKRNKMPKLQTGAGGMRDSTWEEKHVVAGRLVSDTFLNAKELLRQQTSYGLAELMRSQFGRELKYASPCRSLSRSRSR